MTRLPKNVTDHGYTQWLPRIRQGKVRDTYTLPDHPDLLLVVATDRISIFDHVLAATVPDKGAILTAMNVFWRQRVFPNDLRHDLVAAGDWIKWYLPDAMVTDLGSSITNLLARASVVRRLKMQSYEAIVRGFITGSGFTAYQQTSEICGHRLHRGLINGDGLIPPIFTPSTKAEVGHDEHVTAERIRERYGSGPEALALRIYELGYKQALSHDILLADSKFEFGLDEQGLLIIGDEVLTPDSSRYWDLFDYHAMHDRGDQPPSLDKQIVRDWGKGLGIHKRDPKVETDVDWVHAQVVPPEIIKQTTKTYRYILERLTGQSLEALQREMLNL